MWLEHVFLEKHPSIERRSPQYALKRRWPFRSNGPSSNRVDCQRNRSDLPIAVVFCSAAFHFTERKRDAQATRSVGALTALTAGSASTTPGTKTQPENVGNDHGHLDASGLASKNIAPVHHCHQACKILLFMHDSTLYILQQEHAQT